MKMMVWLLMVTVRPSVWAALALKFAVFAPPRAGWADVSGCGPDATVIAHLTEEEEERRADELAGLEK